MLRLKFELPTAKVNYNKVGVLVSKPIPFAPEKVAATGMDIEVEGYETGEHFLAFSVRSSVRSLSLSEQYTLLRQLGFKTVPVHLVPVQKQQVNGLISTAQRYLKYNPVWWDIEKNEEYVLPKLTTITSISWGLDGKRRLTRIVHTPIGNYDVIDHRMPECFQPGLYVKVGENGAEPYMSSKIVEYTPDHCPICNNPLTRFQLGPDTPLILKCKAPLCLKLKVTEEPISISEPEEEVEIENSFLDSDPDEIAEVKILDEPISKPMKKFSVINFDVDLRNSPIEEQCSVLRESDLKPDTDADFIVTRNKRSITKKARKMSESKNIALISKEELESLLKK